MLVELEWVTGPTVWGKGFWAWTLSLWPRAQSLQATGRSPRLRSVSVYKCGAVLILLPACRSRKTTSLMSTECSFHTHHIHFRHQITIIKFTIVKSSLSKYLGKKKNFWKWSHFPVISTLCYCLFSYFKFYTYNFWTVFKGSYFKCLFFFLILNLLFLGHYFMRIQFIVIVFMPLPFSSPLPASFPSDSLLLNWSASGYPAERKPLATTNSQ